jgi:zinc transport system ATP-binding protein
LTPLLTVQDASFAYDGKVAVEGVDFALAAGDYLCIVGENGSGKSTLVNGILGLKQPAGGSIVYDESLRQSSIGYLPQQHFAHGSFPASVLEVVLSGRIGLKGAVPFYTQQDRRLAREALALVGAAALERQWFGGLSGGQRQRVLLARALSTAPDGLMLLILDEPMSGLDPHARADLYTLIQRLNSEQHITVIMVTHDVNTAVHFANRILLLDASQLFYGTPDEFKESETGLDLMRDACGGHCAICGFSHFEEA